MSSSEKFTLLIPDVSQSSLSTSQYSQTIQWNGLTWRLGAQTEESNGTMGLHLTLYYTEKYLKERMPAQQFMWTCKIMPCIPMFGILCRRKRQIIDKEKQTDDDAVVRDEENDGTDDDEFLSLDEDDREEKAVNVAIEKSSWKLVSTITFQFTMNSQVGYIFGDSFQVNLIMAKSAVSTEWTKEELRNEDTWEEMIEGDDCSAEEVEVDLTKGLEGIAVGSNDEQESDDPLEVLEQEAGEMEHDAGEEEQGAEEVEQATGPMKQAGEHERVLEEQAAGPIKQGEQEGVAEEQAAGPTRQEGGSARPQRRVPKRIDRKLRKHLRMQETAKNIRVAQKGLLRQHEIMKREMDRLKDFVENWKPSPEAVARGLMCVPLCYVCGVKPVNKMAMPCRHMGLCAPCSLFVSYCPRCKQPIMTTVTPSPCVLMDRAEPEA